MFQGGGGEGRGEGRGGVEGRVVEKLTHFFLAFVSRMKGIHESQLCNEGKIKAKMHKDTVARVGSAKVSAAVSYSGQ